MDLERLARRQQGVVSRAQALTAGLTPAEVRWRLSAGRWQSIHRGVYLTSNGRVDWPARVWAALLRCGPGSLLVLEAACYLWRLEPTPPAVITVGVPRDRHPRPVDGVVVVRRVSSARAVVDGFPVSRLATTVLDLADRPGCTVADAVALMARACQERALRRALHEVGEGAESAPEVGFETRVRAPHHLPLFERQVVEDDGSRTDLKNRRYGVNVEVDGRLWHAGERFHLDRQRDRRAAARGEVTLRVAPLEIDSAPCEVAGELSLVLRNRGWSGSPRPCRPGCRAGDPTS